MVRIDDVSRTFSGRRGTVEALRGIDLEVAEGEFVAIVGRSGCGKSTLLRLVAGLLEPTGGKVTVDTARRREIAMQFQRPALLPWRNVLNNVLFPVEIFGWKRKAHVDRARGLLATVGLAGFESTMPHELSGGMQQRVSLCRSLIQKPRVMLMDEPFSALDALTREELTVELQRLHMEQGTTTLFVTHSIDEAVLLADRVVVLSPRPGRIAEIVTIDVPRPRSLGQNEHTEELARCSARLHGLLMDRAT
ncbi:ABC transporter ATP-binding protein [Actinoplanes derwentensis]|uniref:NitT/TauT family transport system ATP-binding protein n=1 Tax=Actinoplanes derwentensis TaxID=113562 RepID=A0A1H2D342_9ACTN|nr:ABC transporter ATP-binding protein [Actinoplanes derwentensis]GID88309.1 ABC transporter ATP-binding protein [Actinoplanes derwentensis]SDT77163.1 NitT/TauT family transport system ATP-binding protein [Actinoplanes derwentensis]